MTTPNPNPSSSSCPSCQSGQSGQSDPPVTIECQVQGRYTHEHIVFTRALGSGEVHVTVHRGGPGEIAQISVRSCSLHQAVQAVTVDP